MTFGAESHLASKISALRHFWSKATELHGGRLPVRSFSLWLPRIGMPTSRPYGQANSWTIPARVTGPVPESDVTDRDLWAPKTSPSPLELDFRSDCTLGVFTLAPGPVSIQKAAGAVGVVGSGNDHRRRPAMAGARMAY
jgi:hypothetical protein